MTTPTHTFTHAGRRYRCDAGTHALLSLYLRDGEAEKLARVLREGLASGRIVEEETV